ncbi:putative IQ motif, EF-hand binding, BAG domain, BAG domain superfamily [Helianthus annuus]|uniref:IQ motif, EF-hand binding, BAG domain, BAG domain superfamily n=1 Tax=Helianthus annuus TaxID=4232 RepID=A0A251T002_HELAN|nr:BAG family molecular chaperone regulator 6 [Helianthus annuus]KAF5777027.1 putative IQ motif, EF-hand binding, BAG domain, BAG domain superfamily [Helianthus annuus]KAJ0492191.1 putative IQ motif, EF-hand binding, BAG domain, BAG domain superfamily [Helianthus annuus]KAJ0861864.1 putative IQ motif, EF-hand binding, BAG domain, BAG domain superfamily [Helianthus annuus]
MFDDPFFRAYLSRPVQQNHRSTSPEVIQIPVHFFSSKQPQKPSSLSTKSAAALKIQSLFRGFLVRKSVNKISSIRNQVCEAETSAELIRTDVKERLRVNETLMLLLLKLDSIRGVDFGVREFRKAVINKAIAVQEILDSVVDESVRTVTKQVTDTDSVMNVDGVVDVTVDNVNVVDSVVNDTIRSDETVEIDCGTVTERVTGTDSAMNVDGVVNVTVEDVSVVDSVVDDTIRSGETVVIDCGIVTENATVEDVKEIDVNCDSVEVIDDRNRSIQLLEKLIDDNEKMTSLMTQMFERDEMQTRMINSLSRRVEQLEKTLKPRKKKKKMMHSV